MKELFISAWDFNPNDNAITADLIAFLAECFLVAPIVKLKENDNQYYKTQIEDLAKDIVAIRES